MYEDGVLTKLGSRPSWTTFVAFYVYRYSSITRRFAQFSCDIMSLLLDLSQQRENWAVRALAVCPNPFSLYQMLQTDNPVCMGSVLTLSYYPHVQKRSRQISKYQRSKCRYRDSSLMLPVVHCSGVSTEDQLRGLSPRILAGSRLTQSLRLLKNSASKVPMYFIM